MLPKGTKIAEFISQIKFNQYGLVPTIAQDYHSKEVLMLAWMNAETIKISYNSKIATYFSRSRNEIWQKGKTSGNYQEIINITADCDYDCLLINVKQKGNACHTGQKTCFFNEVILENV